jgi:hypothetical protein
MTKWKCHGCGNIYRRRVFRDECENTALCAKGGLTKAVKDFVRRQELRELRPSIRTYVDAQGVDCVKVEKTRWSGSGEEQVLYNGPMGEALKKEFVVEEEEPMVWFIEDMLVKKFRSSFLIRAHTQPDITLTRQQAMDLMRSLTEIFKREELAQKV